MKREEQLRRFGIRPTRYQRALVLLTWAAVAAEAAILLARWHAIPATIPIHFGASGAPERYGIRGVLWCVPAINLAICAALGALGRFPQLWNTAAGAEDSAPRRAAYFAAARTLLFEIRFAAVVGTAAVGTFAAFLMPKLPSWFTGLYIAAMALPLVLYAVRVADVKKGK